MSGDRSTVEPAEAPEVGAAPSWRQRVRTTYRIVQSNPTGRIALKVVVGLLGLAVVAVGIVLIPLPGPGWALVILGLSIWAIEFVWARHLLRFTRTQLTGWLRWVGRQSLAIRLLIGAAGLVFVSMVVWLSVKYSLGIDLWAASWDYITTH